MNKAINVLGVLFLLGSLVSFGIYAGKIAGGIHLGVILKPLVITLCGIVLGIVLSLLANLKVFGKDSPAGTNRGIKLIGFLFLVLSLVYFGITIFQVIGGVEFRLILGELLSTILGIGIGIALLLLANYRLFSTE